MPQKSAVAYEVLRLIVALLVLESPSLPREDTSYTKLPTQSGKPSPPIVSIFLWSLESRTHTPKGGKLPARLPRQLYTGEGRGNASRVGCWRLRSARIPKELAIEKKPGDFWLLPSIYVECVHACKHFPSIRKSR